MTEYLSEHFTLEEMIYSDTAKAKGISNMPNEAQKKELIHTCKYMLEPFRALLTQHYGCKVYVHINSGFRSAALNAAIPGSSKTSQHSRAQAADVWVYKVTSAGIKTKVKPSEVYGLIKQWVKAGKLTVDQVIDEKSGGAEWTHMSLASQLKDCRKQFLKYNGGRYTLDP